MRSLVALLTLVALTSCGGGDKPSSPTSPVTSPVTSTGPVSTSPSSPDTSSSSSTTTTTPVVKSEITVKFLSGAVDATEENFIEGKGALKVVLGITNLPQGVSESDVTYNFPKRVHQESLLSMKKMLNQMNSLLS